MARMRHTLQALQARAQAAIALAEGGAASLVQTLTGLLPPLANSGQSPKSLCSSTTFLGLHFCHMLCVIFDICIHQGSTWVPHAVVFPAFLVCTLSSAVLDVSWISCRRMYRCWGCTSVALHVLASIVYTQNTRIEKQHPRHNSVQCTLTSLITAKQRLLSADVKGVFVVEADAAAQFMHDVSKANTAEAGLHLLAAVLGQPSASRDAVVATEANALQVRLPPSCN